MSAGIRHFFRVTAAQQRGIAVLVVFLLIFIGAVAVKDCRGAGSFLQVTVIPPDSLSVVGTATGKDTLFYFDPSAADSATFVLLGFTPFQARTILRFRTAVGGRFSSPQQFSRCYAVSDSMFTRLSPYIRIQAPADAGKPADFSRVDINRASLARLRAHSLLNDRLAEKIFHARIRYGGFVDAEQLCRVFRSDSAAVGAFLQYADFDTAAVVRYDINSDSERLLAEHPYISRLFAHHIVLYRERHGRVPCYDTLREIKYFPRSKEEYLGFYLNFDTLKTVD